MIYRTYVHLRVRTDIDVSIDVKNQKTVPLEKRNVVKR